MSETSDRGVKQQELLDQQARELEEQTAENFAVIRAAKEQWETYGLVMQDHARRIEEASIGDDAKNYFVQRRLATRHELGSYVGQLVRQQTEMLDEAEREVYSNSVEQSERLLRENAGASWG